tara:strand:+ start:399 stop:1709 length:1311 start_codon:yes stop_codon:yes gene_type:complete
MGFATGFITGLAKSVDEQLKSDMQRTQKRMDGMEQYRVTRRRAEEDRVKKERREVGEVMKNLASLVGGDMYKAKQLFETGGGTVSGASSFFNELKENQSSLGKDFDINKIVSDLSSVRPEGVTDADFINNYVRGVSKISTQGQMRGSGLLGKIFGGDYGATVDERVDEQAPIEADKFGTIKTAPLKVNHEMLIKRQKYKKDNQIKSKSSFEAQYNEFDMAAFYEDDPEEKRKLEKKRDEFYKKYLEDKKLSKSATGKSTTLFSKEPVTGIISKANLAAVDGAGYTEGIGEQMKVLLEGNEGPVFEAKINAMKALRARFKSTNPKDEPILFDAIKAEENLQQLQRNKYINDRETDYIASTKDDDAVVYEKYQTKDVTKGLFAGIPQAASADEQFKLEKKMIKETAKKEGYTPGKVIEYEAPNGKLLRLIWTGQSLIQ